MTSDGAVVLDHDGVRRGRLRKYPIRDSQRSELASHIPDFRELVSSVPRATHVSIDVKDFQAVDQLMSDAGAENFPLHQLWLCHFEIDKVLEIKRRYPDVRVVDSTRLSKIKEGVETRAARLADHKIDALNMHVSDWSGGLVTLLHRFEVLCFGWDAQFAPVLETGFLMGLDGVYSDHIDRLVAAYEKIIGLTPP
jgi:glycerophosphoryl diester phosphodiesterase